MGTAVEVCTEGCWRKDFVGVLSIGILYRPISEGVDAFVRLPCIRLAHLVVFTNFAIIITLMSPLLAFTLS